MGEEHVATELEGERGGRGEERVRERVTTLSISLQGSVALKAVHK